MDTADQQYISNQVKTGMKPWLSIHYYEKNQKCGEEFIGYNENITVDG